MKIRILSVLIAGCLLACTAPDAPDESVDESAEELIKRCAAIECSATFTDWLVDHPAECGDHDYCHYSVSVVEPECIWETGCTSNILGPSHGMATVAIKAVRVTYELDAPGAVLALDDPGPGTAASCAPFCAPEYKPKFDCK